MPIRLVREGIISSQRINALSRGAELFYRRLMSVVDDYGRFYAAPGTLRGACWPTCPDKVSESEISDWIAEILQAHSNCLADGKQLPPLMFLYEANNCKYLQITDFRQQTRSPSKFPKPDEQLLSSCSQNVQPRRYSKTETETLFEDGDGSGANDLAAPQSGEDWFESIYSRHPKKKDRNLAAQYLSQVKVDRKEFERVHSLWCHEWEKEKPQFAPSLAQWILDQGWKYPPMANGSGRPKMAQPSDSRYVD